MILNKIFNEEKRVMSFTFQQPTDCSTYNYSLVLHDSTHNQTSLHKVTSMDLQGRSVKVIFKHLLENSELNFRIFVTNGITEIISNGVDICKPIEF